MNRIRNGKHLRKWSAIGIAAAVISLGTLASVIPAHAANSAKTAAQAATTKDSGRIKDILALAKQGKVQGSGFVSGKTNIKEVHKLWGASESLGHGYERYDFSMGKGAYDLGISSKTGIVYDLRYYFPLPDPDRGLSQFTFNAVIAALGMPKAVTFNGNDKIYTYTAGSHQLKFVGPKTAPKGQSSAIAHINVYTPKANV
ncbi:YjgB family protein [Paenibacillus sp. MWE-103]|uniref:YjgB family protein n=1 Tax=Paenibacillus artemisiicola TaxID=1172618 RepID=A0ABS3W5B7_9BACL|nr:YjgB family protein [Paenibacillus artemisiicola]MBO7743512.1 YjgB family protein [Paenibacillus artemisiicola]